MSTHPDYPIRHGVPAMDRCKCGGVRHWHAMPPYGCDDCACTEFVLDEDWRAPDREPAQLLWTLKQIENVLDYVPTHESFDQFTGIYRRSRHFASYSALTCQTVSHVILTIFRFPCPRANH